MSEKLAIHGGTPIRGKDNPLPSLFPRTIGPTAMENLRRVIESGFTLDLTTQFEQAFAEACGVKYAVAMVNCTATVHAAVAVCNINPGDEVIVSPISDYGSVAGILWQNAIPVFPDVDIRTGNVTAEEIEKKIGPRTKAIIVVHFYGLFCDMDPIIEVARKHKLILIEDACQVPLAEYKGRMAGSMGDMGAFSFDAEKHFSTEHGGVVITDNKELADALRRFSILRGAIPKERYGRVHVSLGNNYRYGNLQAAVGLAQLPLLREQNRRRTQMAFYLNELLDDVEGIHTPYVIPGSVPIYWLYFIRFDLERFKADIHELSDALVAEGIPGGSGRYYLIPESHTFLADKAHAYGSSRCPFDCPATDFKGTYGPECVPIAAKHAASVFRWNWHDKFTEKDVEDMAKAIKKVVRYYLK